jgi:Signal transduction histidine kinase
MAAGDDAGRSVADVYSELSALVGGLAHEIRNPLSTIQLNMELLAEDFSDESSPGPHRQRDRRAKAKIELVRQECERLQRLLGDFLDFARHRPSLSNSATSTRKSSSARFLCGSCGGGWG